MTQENQATPKKNKFVPRWVKSTWLWKFMSNLKLVFKRMLLSSPYWDRSRFLQTFRYFMAVEDPVSRQDYLASFRWEGIDFDLRPMEWHLMQAILLENEYGGKIVQLFEKEQPSVVIDAGANVGMFSVFALSKWKDAKVLAVEPAPETFDLLAKNHKKNPALNWRVFQYAFWETNGMIYFESEGSSMAAHVSMGAKGVEVSSIRLDHFIEKHLDKGERISLLKMDIEGAEEVTLRAAQNILQRVDAMVIEIHSSVCNEIAVRDILTREFKFVYDLSTPSTQYPVVLASRLEVL